MLYSIIAACPYGTNVPHYQYTLAMHETYISYRLQEYTGGEEINAHTLVGNIQNVSQNIVVTNEEEHQLRYAR